MLFLPSGISEPEIHPADVVRADQAERVLGHIAILRSARGLLGSTVDKNPYTQRLMFTCKRCANC